MPSIHTCSPDRRNPTRGHGNERLRTGSDDGVTTRRGHTPEKKRARSESRSDGRENSDQNARCHRVRGCRRRRWSPALSHRECEADATPRALITTSAATPNKPIVARRTGNHAADAEKPCHLTRELITATPCARASFERTARASLESRPRTTSRIGLIRSRSASACTTTANMPSKLAFRSFGRSEAGPLR